jgi:hypothetical protein
MNYLIYAAYGSNLLKERFMVYIKGGKYRGREYRGSIDKTEPRDLGWMYVPHRLYFAKSSPRWGYKGVAFLGCEKEKDNNFYAVARLWKVSEQQFEDIKEQEGQIWYNVELELGEKDSLIIKTITGCWGSEITEPSEEYLSVIKEGLKETTGWSDDKIEEYLRKFF